MTIHQYRDRFITKSADSDEIDAIIANPDFDPLQMADFFVMLEKHPGIIRRLTKDPEFFLGLFELRPTFLKMFPEQIHWDVCENLKPHMEEVWHKKSSHKEAYGFIHEERNLVLEISRLYRGRTVEYALKTWAEKDATIKARKFWNSKDYQLIQGDRKVKEKPPKVPSPVVKIRKEFQRYPDSKGSDFQIYPVRGCVSIFKVKNKSIMDNALNVREIEINHGGKTNIRLRRQRRSIYAYNRAADNRAASNRYGTVEAFSEKIPIKNGGEELYERMLDWMEENWGEIVWDEPKEK